MLKNKSTLTCKINDSEFQFICDQEVSLTNVKEALFQFMKYIGQVEDKYREQHEKEVPEQELALAKSE
jgi:hypothetical protein